jgi:hypothetical protein
VERTHIQDFIPFFSIGCAFFPGLGPEMAAIVSMIVICRFTALKRVSLLSWHGIGGDRISLLKVAVERALKSDFLSFRSLRL